MMNYLDTYRTPKANYRKAPVRKETRAQNFQRVIGERMIERRQGKVLTVTINDKTRWS